MKTNDKSICTPEYWARIFEGNNLTGKLDRSDNKRPANAFDRFKWAADQVEGPKVRDIASGHAYVPEYVKSAHRDWDVVASDQTPAAKKVSRYDGPYVIGDAYTIWDENPLYSGIADTVTVTAAFEYFEFPDKFLAQVKKHARYFVLTVCDGEMAKWSQLYVYNEDSMTDLLSKYGDIVHYDSVPGMMLFKVKF